MIRKLEPKDDVQNFTCGDSALDSFLKQFAKQNQYKHYIGTTYVYDSDEGQIAGYVTISPGSMEASLVPKAPARYPMPILRVARLAVSTERQGQGIAGKLMRTVFDIAHQIADMAGCFGVVVDAKPNAVDYYARLGFTALDASGGKMLGGQVMMFLPIGQIPKSTR